MSIDSENTMRALKDVPLLVNSRWCRFGIHRWTVWNKGEWVKDEWGERYFTQYKTCACCNTIRSKRVKGLKTV